MIQFPKPDVDQFFRTYAISNFAVSHDETKLIFSTNLNGTFNLWAIDFPVCFPYQFAQYDQQCNVLKLDRSNRFVLAGFDHEGDENYQIYALPFDGGKPQPLITGKKEDKYYLIELSKDGKYLYYVTSKDNPRFLTSYRFNPETQEHELLHQGDGALELLCAVAPNQKDFLTAQVLGNTYQITYLHTEGERISLTPDPSKVHFASEAVFANDSMIYFVTDYDQEFAYVAKFDIFSREFSPVLQIDDESVSTIKWHEASKKLWIKTEKGVTDHLYTWPTVRMDSPA